MLYLCYMETMKNKDIIQLWTETVELDYPNTRFILGLGGLSKEEINSIIKKMTIGDIIEINKKIEE